MNKYTEGLTEEQLERYDFIKATALRYNPYVERDHIKLELWEKLWRYFAIHNILPEAKDKGEKEERITEYRTPADIETTLNKDHSLIPDNKVINELENVIEGF